MGPAVPNPNTARIGAVTIAGAATAASPATTGIKGILRAWSALAEAGKGVKRAAVYHIEKSLVQCWVQMSFSFALTEIKAG